MSTEYHDEPTFEIVFAIRSGADYFSIEGIFSEHKDAQELMDHLNASDQFQGVTNMNGLRQTMHYIKEFLVAERLGALAKSFSVTPKEEKEQ